MRADAANTLARLRARVAISRLEAALDDSDAIVRANAARALGVAQSRSSAASLTALVSQDADERVRVSAIRALAAIKDERALTVLLARAESLFSTYRQGKAGGAARPSESNELLEIASALGGVAGGAGDGRALQFLKNLRAGERMMAPELEVAWARISPPEYVRAVEDALSQRATSAQLFRDWRIVSATGQGLGEVAQLTEKAASAEDLQAARAAAQRAVASLLNHPRTPTLAMPDLLRAFAAFKTTDAGDVFAQHLAKSRDVMVRATAAELIGELPPSPELSQALAASLQNALADAMNDASLAVLDALGKQKDALQKDDAGARRAIKAALAARDHLIRRRAARLLQTSGAGDGASSVGVVEMNQTTSDYERALARLNRRVTARIFTDKGSFAIELLPREAPLTVDSFIKLARRGFFNDLTFHRVVPNFVIQGGDPRGDGNGGPLYQIRCEINETPYERGAVGMALSGKDTGGSQWFVTHAPQPHLDGGYTVFGRVVEGMDVVDAIVRGDRMRRVTITESKR
ncbi:MAG: peptidylprolyl isomerase [Pyrinomonadaceae bacterium]